MDLEDQTTNPTTIWHLLPLELAYIKNNKKTLKFPKMNHKNVTTKFRLHLTPPPLPLTTPLAP